MTCAVMPCHVPTRPKLVTPARKPPEAELSAKPRRSNAIPQKPLPPLPATKGPLKEKKGVTVIAALATKPARGRRTPAVKWQQKQSTTTPEQHRALEPPGTSTSAARRAAVEVWKTTSNHTPKTPSTATPTIPTSVKKRTEYLPSPQPDFRIEGKRNINTLLKVKVQLPQGPEVYVPVGVKRYRVRVDERKWALRLNPETGEIWKATETSVSLDHICIFFFFSGFSVHMRKSGPTSRSPK